MTKENRLRVSGRGVSLLYLGRCLHRQTGSRGTIERNRNRAGEWGLRGYSRRRLSAGTSWCGQDVRASLKRLDRDVTLMLVCSSRNECVSLKATGETVLLVGIAYFLLGGLWRNVENYI